MKCEEPRCWWKTVYPESTVKSYSWNFNHPDSCTTMAMISALRDSSFEHSSESMVYRRKPRLFDRFREGLVSAVPGRQIPAVVFSPPAMHVHSVSVCNIVWTAADDALLGRCENIVEWFGVKTAWDGLENGTQSFRVHELRGFLSHPSAALILLLQQKFKA